MLLAGPLADKTGSLIVIEADSLEHANRIAQEDPYTVNGVFQRVGSPSLHPGLPPRPPGGLARLIHERFSWYA